ncbi:hypothetical protein ACFSKU_20425 [Pontibacter silvestris]|uniref:Lipoprotein n=1 Tax=Pontibacter silvestris TaxID=2305183 RepID=A0ABW4X3Q5_9BACT|nr:hypothetical protein [Pontibacter silvestris]MCC9137071.1 hypothetical protein [Pontibacter silvestris]
MHKLVIPFLLIIIFLFLGSCSDNNNELLEKLQAAVEEENAVGNDFHVVDMDSLTDFEWETLYFFDAGEDKRSISDQIGFKWDGPVVPDLHRRLLFVNEGQVVTYTDYKFDDFPLMVYGCNEDRWVYPRSRSRFATFRYCNQNNVIYPFIPVTCVENLSGMMGQDCPEAVAEE